MFGIYIISAILVFIVAVITNYFMLKNPKLKEKYKDEGGNIFKVLLTIAILLIPIVNILFMSSLLFRLAGEANEK
jgi:hypothetical protein